MQDLSELNQIFPANFSYHVDFNLTNIFLRSIDNFVEKVSNSNPNEILVVYFVNALFAHCVFF